MARPKIPAARKSRKTVKTLNEETARSTEEVPFGVNLIAHHLTEIASMLGMLVDAIALAPAPSAPVADPQIVSRVTSLEAQMQEILNKPPRLLARVEALESRGCACGDDLSPSTETVPGVQKRHRRTKAEMEAARAAEAASVTASLHAQQAPIQPQLPVAPNPAPKADRATCTHPQTALITTNPKLSRCLLCGAIIETPAAAQVAPVAATPPPPPPPPPAAATPTLDDVRGAAISWIGKHGKEKFTALLMEKYGAAQISAVPQAQWGALIATLTNGG